MSYKVQLEIFEGPLDLLLYLIKKSEINIHDIPINLITEQYLEYLNLMQMMDLNIAGEFLVMAATLMHIKSRMLLPPEEQPQVESEEEDPREELVRRLLEYKKFKDAASQMREQEHERSQYYTRYPQMPEMDAGDSPFLEASLFDLINAFSRALQQVPKEIFHQVMKDEFTVAEKVHEIFHLLVKRNKVAFSELFKKTRNKLEVITIFLAVLELIRLKEVLVIQNCLFDDIEIRRNSDNIVPPALAGASYAGEAKVRDGVSEANTRGQDGAE